MDYIMKRCIVCNGTKQLLALGNIYKDCDNCLGTGYLDDTDTLVQQIGDDKNVVKIKYKRGRPKKESTNQVNVNE